MIAPYFGRKEKPTDTIHQKRLTVKFSTVCLRSAVSLAVKTALFMSWI